MSAGNQTPVKGAKRTLAGELSTPLLVFVPSTASSVVTAAVSNAEREGAGAGLAGNAVKFELLA